MNRCFQEQIELFSFFFGTDGMDDVKRWDFIEDLFYRNGGRGAESESTLFPYRTSSLNNLSNVIQIVGETGMWAGRLNQERSWAGLNSKHYV